MFYVYQSYHGPIPHLRLPRNAWKALRNADIGIHELVAVAQRIERFDGIGVKTAQAIRAELGRVVEGGR